MSGDSGQAAGTTARAAGPNPIKRFFEILFMLFSAFLVIFSWDRAAKASEENAVLRAELRRAKKPGDNPDRSGTRCTVCLDNPREVLFKECGHVCVCSDCAARIQYEDNRCPVCRLEIRGTESVYIS